MNTYAPVYTMVIDRNGNSYPAGGCRIAPVLESDHDNIWSFSLLVIAPSGNEFTIENDGKDWSDQRPAPARMVEDRDRITQAIKNSEHVIDLRDEILGKAT